MVGKCLNGDHWDYWDECEMDLIHFKSHKSQFRQLQNRTGHLNGDLGGLLGFMGNGIIPKILNIPSIPVQTNR
jgi:hypothetical protein